MELHCINTWAFIIINVSVFLQNFSAFKQFYTTNFKQYLILYIIDYFYISIDNVVVLFLVVNLIKLVN